MKTTILLFVIALISACATRPVPKLYNRVYEQIGHPTTAFEDKDIQFIYSPDTSSASIPISIKNKSSMPIKVIWDEIAFINEKGQSERIIHEGVKIADRSAPMPPTVIPPGATKADMLVLSSRIEWGRQGWDRYPICGTTKYDVAWDMIILENEDQCVGQIFGIFFTYEIDGKKRNFTTKFKYVSRIEAPNQPKK